MLARFADFIGVQAQKFSVDRQNFAIEKGNLFIRRRVREVEVAEALAIRSEDLDELLMLTGNGWATPECVTNAAAQNDTVGVGIFLRLEAEDFFP